MKDLNNHLVLEINNKIESWSKENPKLVVAIDGYSGVGKTTISNELEKINTDILVIHQDDFLISKTELENLLQNTADKSLVFELKNIDSNKVIDIIKKYRSGEQLYETQVFNPVSGNIDIEKTFDLSKKVLVIEGVFMFHPESLDGLWDKRIYIAGNLEDIDKRRVEREKKRWGKDYFPEDHPDSYFGQVIVALKRYMERYEPQGKADLVIDTDIN